MPSRSKQKGNRFEREVVNRAKELHIGAERAYASNGLSLGHAEEVDVVLDGADKEWRVQCKVRKNIARSPCRGSGAPWSPRGPAACGSPGASRRGARAPRSRPPRCLAKLAQFCDFFMLHF